MNEITASMIAMLMALITLMGAIAYERGISALLIFCVSVVVMTLATIIITHVLG